MERANEVLAVASLLVIVGAWAITSSLDDSNDESNPLLVEGPVLTIRGGPLLQRASVEDPSAFMLSLNGLPPIEAVDAFRPRGSEPAINVIFPEGAGSADGARVVYQGEEHDARVVTAPDMVPGTRYWAAHASDGRYVYVFGGVTFPLGHLRVNGETYLDSVLRLDLSTGDVRTLGARLPVSAGHAAAVWDPRSTAVCPSGCAYVFAGETQEGQWLDTVLRYEPTSDRIVPLDVRLPEPLLDPVALWTGSDVLVLAGARYGVHRFDPVEESVETLSRSPWTAVWGSAAFFDSRSTPDCPRGCAYLLGGQDPNMRPLVMFPNSPNGPMNRATIVRIDASTGQATLLDTFIPEPRSGHATVWDGTTAHLVGGIACDESQCWAPEEIIRFDPARLEAAHTSIRVPERPLYTNAVVHEGSLVTVGGLSTSDVVISNPLDGFNKIDPVVGIDRILRIPLT